MNYYVPLWGTAESVTPVRLIILPIDRNSAFRALILRTTHISCLVLFFSCSFIFKLFWLLLSLYFISSLIPFSWDALSESNLVCVIPSFCVLCFGGVTVVCAVQKNAAGSAGVLK